MECFDFRRSTDGRTMQIRATETDLEWKYASEKEWKKLIAFSDIGTTNYDELSNIPTINNKELKGQLTLDELCLVPGWVGTNEEYEAVRKNLPPETICYITDDEEQTSENTETVT